MPGTPSHQLDELIVTARKFILVYESASIPIKLQH